MMGSTDVGDVSWVVPTVQARGATYAIGTPGHSWQLTAQGKTAAAHKGLVHVAKVMACTAVDVLQDDVLLARAKADHQARVGRTPYVCPLPTNWIRPSRCPHRSRLSPRASYRCCKSAPALTEGMAASGASRSLPRAPAKVP